MRRSSLIFTAAIMLPAFASSAHAGTTLPTRKAGFWVSSMSMQFANAPPGFSAQPHVSAMCTDPATDLKLMTQTPPGADCAAPVISGGGSSYNITTTCKSMPGDPQPLTVSTTLTIISDDQMNMTMNGSAMKMSGTSKWQGPCPAGWVPGDVGQSVNGTMTKISNVLNLPKAPGG
jgi:hypothetical protein